MCYQGGRLLVLTTSSLPRLTKCVRTGREVFVLRLAVSDLSRSNVTSNSCFVVDLSSFPGSTDMVKYWNKLGFVVKDANDFAWTERERQSIPPS
jgi:hypothetical protein